MNIQLLFQLTLVLLVGLSAPSQAVTPPQYFLDQSYEQAVQDASYIEPEEIFKRLIAINSDNKALVFNPQGKIRVSTWKSRESYEKFMKPYENTSDNPAFVVWVTTYPQVKNFCSNYLAKQSQDPDKTDLDLRLKQYLGLNHTWSYDVMIDMWVDPKQLFRPCVDPQTDDKQCELQFQSTLPVVENIDNYPTFYQNLYFQDFRTGVGVPWTGLGYTYDWGNAETPVGASEFILVPKAAYEIISVENTLDYCQG